jgi:PKD repeat protein
MKQLITPLFLLFGLILANNKLFSQCNPAFLATVNQHTADFSASANLPNLYHSWYFGDGTTGSGNNTLHDYDKPGQYTVKHIVTDSANSCVDSSMQVVNLSFQVTCNADFIFSRDTSWFNPSGYHFVSTSGYSESGIERYEWKINNHIIGSYNSYSYTFTPGVYNVCLTIFTNAGCTSSVCKPITVIGSENCNLQAAFTYSAFVNNPKQINFIPSQLRSNTKYLWNFGDSYTNSIQSYAANVAHTYQQAGTYSVYLAVLDTLTNCYDTVRQNISVQGLSADSCTVLFNYTSNNYGQVSFTALSNQTIVL